jgi:uncharacterized protein (TIGR03067 family)
MQGQTFAGATSRYIALVLCCGSAALWWRRPALTMPGIKRSSGIESRFEGQGCRLGAPRKQGDGGGCWKLSVVNSADGTWTLDGEGKVIRRRTSMIDPMKQPKTMDFMLTAGKSKGNPCLGIYELGDKIRKLSFAPPGQDRPSEFSSTPRSESILVTFEREKK